MKQRIYSFGATDIGTVIQWLEGIAIKQDHHIQHFQIVTRVGEPTLYVGIVLCNHDYDAGTAPYRSIIG